MRHTNTFRLGAIASFIIDADRYLLGTFKKLNEVGTSS